MIGNVAVKLEDFECLIEKEMGKVTLDRGESSCLVPKAGVIIKEEYISDDEGKCETLLPGRGVSVLRNVKKEVEMEEGEIIASYIDGTVASSGDEDDEDGLGEDGAFGPLPPLGSKKELMVLPPVPPVNVTLQPHHQTLPLGVVLSIFGVLVTVEGVEKHNPLDEGSILWITETRSPLGIVYDIFGPVKNPYYIIRYNTENEVPSGLKPGDSVCFVQEFVKFILIDKSLYDKAYDESEICEEEFSDDEKEAEYMKMLKMKKRDTINEYAGNKKMEKPGNSRQNHRPSNPPVVPRKLGLGNGQCSSSVVGHDSNVGPGFTPPFSQIGQNPCFIMQSTGFPTSNVLPWLGQVNPQMFYQMIIPNGGGLIPPFGMIPTISSQNTFYPPPAFTPWPGVDFGQNMFDPCVYATMLAAQNQQLSFPFNGGQQAFPFNNLQQMGTNTSQPETSAVSSQGQTKGQGRGDGGRKPHHKGRRGGGGGGRK